MRVTSSLVRSEDAGLPPIFSPVLRTRGRPQTQYRVRISSEQDVTVARHHAVPVHTLTAELITTMGYPVRFPPILVAARSVIPLIDTDFRTVLPFVSEDAAMDPRPEDAVVAMLRYDAFGARAIWERRTAVMDPHYLLSRLFQEHLEERATWVRFPDVLPGLKPKGRPLAGRESLARRLRKNRAGAGS
jgi:hypothetical protein